jgi:hypothetical protein
MRAGDKRLDSQGFVRFEWCVACVIAIWYVLLLPLVRQLRKVGCHACVRCLQLVLVLLRTRWILVHQSGSVGVIRNSAFSRDTVLLIV